MRAQIYEITFLGQASATLRAEFDDCEVTIGPGTSTLRAELPDRGALSGLMERINSLGLDVIDVSLVVPQAEQLPLSPILGDDADPARRAHSAARSSHRAARSQVWSLCSDWRADSDLRPGGVSGWGGT